jgi:hypothetical protein
VAFRDYEEFIAAFNDHRVRYLLIGAHAVALYARPRATKDLDVLIDPARTNPHRALTAMQAFLGGAELGYTPDDLADPDSIIQLGVAPVRIDLISSIPGCPSFGAAWDRRTKAHFGSVPANYIGFEDLIRAKRATGRDQDLADLRALERAQGRQGR